MFIVIWANFKAKLFDFRWKFPEKPSASKTLGYSNTYYFSAKQKYKQFGVLSMRGFGCGKSETYQYIPLLEPILRQNFLTFR